MRRKWIFGIVFLLSVFVVPAVAQDPTIEYGQASELRGVTKVFVDTGIASWQRDMIVKMIGKNLPQLEVVPHPEESDIHLRFSLRETRSGNTEGVGTVVKLVGGNRVRVLLSIRDAFPPIFERGTVINFGMEHAKPNMFAREFVKAYKRANS
jgi:hypothetical protein